MEERDRGRLGLGVGSAGEAIAMQLERSFAILGLKLEESRNFGQGFEAAEGHPLRLARAFDLPGGRERLAGDLARQRRRLAGGHRDQCFGRPVAFLCEGEESEDAFVAVEFGDDLALGLGELRAEAAGVGGFQAHLVGREGQAGKGEEVSKQTLQGHWLVLMTPSCVTTSLIERLMNDTAPLQGAGL